MARRTGRNARLKAHALEKHKAGVAGAFNTGVGSAIVQSAIRTTPGAVPLMLDLFRLKSRHSTLLWVGCGCGEEVYAILRQVAGLYIVAVEISAVDLGTFRSKLTTASGVQCVANEPDEFRLRKNGAKVRLVCADACTLTNEAFVALAPRPITHLFSFAVGPSGWWKLHVRLIEFAWASGVRAVLPRKMWDSAGFLRQTFTSIGDVHKASWYTSVANQKFSFVAMDLPAAKPLEVGARVRTRFQDNGEPRPPKDHLIFAGKVLKTSDDGFFVDVRCDRDQEISKRTPLWWVSLVDKAQEKARWTRGA